MGRFFLAVFFGNDFADLVAVGFEGKGFFSGLLLKKDFICFERYLNRGDIFGNSCQEFFNSKGAANLIDLKGGPAGVGGFPFILLLTPVNG